MAIRIACTALVRRIVAGHLAKDGFSFKGGGIDVTSDCLKAVIDFVGPGKTVEVHVGGTPRYEISVREIAPNSDSKNEPALG